MYRSTIIILLLCCIPSTSAFAQRISIKAGNPAFALQTVEESRNRYDLMDPSQVVGQLTYDGIILPVVAMDEEGKWHQIQYRIKAMDEFSDFIYYAYSPDHSPSVMYPGREVTFWYDDSDFVGFLARCPSKKQELPCDVHAQSSGIVLTWQAAPAFFEEKTTVAADSFHHQAPIIEAFLQAESKHIEENKHYENNGRFYASGGIPVYRPERDSAAVNITYSQSGVLRDSLHLFYVEARREFPGPCNESVQSGLLLVEGNEIDYVPNYYYAGECWGKQSRGTSIPLAAFTFTDRLFIMEEFYGYAGKSITVNEVITNSDAVDN